MTSEREPVDDAALIAEAERLASKEVEIEEMGTLKWDRTMIAHLIRLAREGWQPPAPEPDRAEVLACELWKLGETPILGEREAIIRRHFDELRAEWEAERPVIDVPDGVIEAAKLVKEVYGPGYLYANRLSDFIFSLANGAGVRAKGPSQ